MRRGNAAAGDSQRVTIIRRKVRWPSGGIRSSSGRTPDDVKNSGGSGSVIRSISFTPGALANVRKCSQVAPESLETADENRDR